MSNVAVNVTLDRILQLTFLERYLAHDWSP